MKKEKGFTLIELLAVIIILGILMLVAIPSVTTYINSSRKSAYVDTALQYVKAATTMVNSQTNISHYEEDTLLMIPAGHDKDYSMIALESGGASPYNSTYEFAYVGVTYDNKTGSYTYYFMASDASKQGIAFVPSKTLEGKDATEYVFAGMNAATSKYKYPGATAEVQIAPFYEQFFKAGSPATGLYRDGKKNDAKVTVYDAENSSKPSGFPSSQTWKKVDTTNKMQQLLDVVKANEGSKTVEVKKIKVCTAKVC